MEPVWYKKIFKLIDGELNQLKKMLKSENNHFKDNLKHYIDIYGYYNKHEKFKLYKFIYSANIRKIGKNKWKIRVRL